MAINCPNCSTVLADDARFCTTCGAHISGSAPQTGQPAATIQDQAKQAGQTVVDLGQKAIGAGQEAASKAASYVGKLSQQAPASGAARYGALRTIAGFANILGIFFAGITFLAGVGAGCSMRNYDDNLFFALGPILGSILAAGLIYLTFRIMAESIYVILDIENNTRRSSQLLEMLTRKKD